MRAIGSPAQHGDEECGIKMHAIGSPPQHGLSLGLDHVPAVWTGVG